MTDGHLSHELSTRSGRLFNVLTHSVPGFVWLVDSTGNVDFVNSTWCRYTGLSELESFGRGWLRALHPDDRGKFEAIWPPRDDERNPACEIQLRFRRNDGEYRWHLVRANPVADSRDHWIGCSTDIHDLVAMQQKDGAQVEILKMVASNQDVQAVLEALCELGEEQLPASRCTVLLLSDDQTEFAGGAASFLPEHLRDLIAGTRIGPGVGSCGTAAYEKRDVVSANISTDPLWEQWRRLFEPLGIVACWSLPVCAANGDVLATFGFYFFEERSPTGEELKSLDNLRHLAALAIEKARTMQALRESEEHHRYTVEYNPQIPWTTDPQGRITSVSSRWREATGLSVESAMGNGWFQALHPDDVEPVKSYWRDHLQTGEPADLKYRIRLEDGSYRWVRARASARRDTQGRIVKWYGTVEDIHDLELATERLRNKVYVDDLTRLANRRAFEEALRDRLESAPCDTEGVDLLIVDIDNFGHINDRFGHEAGDAALRLFARHLRSCLAEGDMVARFAGDEFAIILQDRLDGSQLQRHAARLAQELERRMGRSAKTRHSGISIGCATSEPREKADDLIRRAKLALNAAKNDSNSPAKLFTPALRKDVDERNEQIELAKRALKSDWLVPYYQPMVNLETGRVAGAEALLRIKLPSGSVLSPAAIWAALDAPKINKTISDRMLELVLSDLAGWKPWPTELGTVSINLSTETLMHEGLARMILRKLARKGIAPTQITVEITERVLVDDLAPRTYRSLRDLQRNGVRVSLDDFGTGFASLTHLQKLPVNEIKIDRAFLNGLAAHGPNAAIVKSMIGLGLNMGVDVVAEGVETAGEAALLRGWGCRFAQGYHFFKPVPAEEFGRICESTVLEIEADSEQPDPAVQKMPLFAVGRM